MTAALLDLQGLDPDVLLVVAVLLVLVQTGLVVGFVVPAGKAAVLTGILAGVDEVPLLLAWVGVVLAAVVGATIGYETGRRHGDRVLAHRWLLRYETRIAQGRDLVQRRAAFAIVVGRVVAILRATTPALAGAVGVSRSTFLLWNVVGGLLWGTVFVGLGYVGATSVSDLVDRFGAGPVVAVGLAAAVLVLGVVLAVRARGRARARTASV